MPDNTNHGAVHKDRSTGVQVLSLAAVALLVSGCSLVSDTTPISDAPAPSTEAPGEHEEGSAHDEFYEGIPSVTWDAGTDNEVEAVAVEVMGLFARPNEPERRWYTDLLPHLSAEYAEAAQYIDPARVRVSEVRAGPVLSREKDNPLTVTAQFDTDAGPWNVLLHRVGQDEPWLVEAIEPATP